MKILARPTITQRNIDYIYVELPAQLAAWLIDQWQFLTRISNDGYERHPPLLWCVYSDTSMATFCGPVSERPFPRFQEYSQALLDKGWVVLPDDFTPDSPTLPGAEPTTPFKDYKIETQNPAVLVTTEGVCWTQIYNNKSIASAVIDYDVIRVAAGLLPPDHPSLTKSLPAPITEADLEAELMRENEDEDDEVPLDR